ncbi:MAG: glutamate synthase [Eubacteriales bacterium]
MKTINAEKMDFEALNALIRESEGDLEINGVLGQRFIGDGAKNRDIIINGTPGNALGAYLDGANITVNGNAQDATGDTMNSGRIVIHGNCGDTAGYAMCGGEIYIRGNCGYRAGIHMKAYKEKFPTLVIGGSAGSFLGEYQAGGLIIVLGLGVSESKLLGYFCGTGMHGGKIFVRANKLSASFPPQVKVSRATDEDMESVKKYISEYSSLFGADESEIYRKKFYVLSPNTSSPYKQLYVQN